MKKLIFIYFLSAAIDINSNFFSKYLVTSNSKPNMYVREKASVEDEAFVRDIAKEMNITKPFNVYYMSKNEIKTLSPVNAAVVEGNNVILGPYFLDTLPIDEKRFIIGHELAHLEKDHVKASAIVNRLGSILNGITLGCYLYSIIKPKTPKQFFSSKSFNFSWISYIASILGQLYYSRCLEYEADEIAVTKLNELDGGINWATNMKKHYYMGEHTGWLRILSTHPTFNERIERFKKLKEKYVGR